MGWGSQVVGVNLAGRFSEMAVGCKHGLALHWRATGCASPDWCDDADLDEDGTVTAAELAELVAHWLDSAPGWDE